MKRTFTSNLRMDLAWMHYLLTLLGGKTTVSQLNFFDDELVSLERKMYDAQNKGAGNERNS